MKKRSIQNKKITASFYVVAILTALLAVLWWMLFKPLSANASEYAIHGFDVSHHQKDVQWEKISPQQYRFVYLKATEGGDFQDRKFQENWLKAREQGFLVGAYHFYRLCRDGKAQAEHFIATVPNRPDALPPVIDLEYDSKCIDTYSKEQLLQEIQIMHDSLKNHYAKQPIFYISKAFYNIVLADQFTDIPLWVREYKGLPDLKGEPKWLFWQHTNKGKIQGITTPVDLNVFYGSEREWQHFLKKNNIPPNTAP